MRRLEDDERAQLQVVVTGAHLVDSLGATWREVEADGIRINGRVDLELTETTALGVAHSLAVATERLAHQLEILAPDVLVLLGDRYEILAAAQAALLLALPVAHLHGGESTEGAIDEAIRHAVTKMSHLHFVSADAHRRRVLQLGEDPQRIFNVGAFALDAIEALEPLTVDELSARAGLDLAARPWLLVTYHPTTLELDRLEAAVEAVCSALERLKSFSVLATKANADPGGQFVNRRLDELAAREPDRVRVVASLGQRAYLSALRHASVVVGNSSSGLIEAPASGVPTVNIGGRQRGRLRAPSVIDVPERRDAIVAAVERAADDEARRRAARRQSPYGAGGAAQRTAEELLTQPLDGILEKRFHDLPVER